MSQKRINYGKKHKNLPEIDLSLVQRESWEWFLNEGIDTEISQISPIDDFTGKNWQLILGEHSLGEPKVTPSEAIKKGTTYSVPFKVKTTLINKKTEEAVEQEVFFGNLPQMTESGTFIVNGIERAVINQLVRSPGIYFSGARDRATGRMLYRGEVRPLHGSWLEFEISKNDVISARIDKRRKVNAATFLRAMGVSSDNEIRAIFKEIDTDKNHNYIERTLEKDTTDNRETALLEIYRKIRPGEPAVLDNAENLFKTHFFDSRRYNLGRVGRYKINKRLVLEIPNEPQNWVLTKDDIVATLKYMIGLQNGEGRVDDIDHLSNRRLRRVGELVATHAFRVGLLRLERSVKEKMSLVSPDDKPLPQNLINARPLVSAINEFFRSNQLSTILENTNPLSEIDNLRRISVLGPGGINRERASFSIRDINTSQYGRIDPVRSPEGPNIGLVTYLALYARVNEFGFLETPYKKVDNKKISDEITYMTADDEETFRITHSSIEVDENDMIVPNRVAIRHKGDYLEGPTNTVEYIDISPRQVFGASASLIPFLAHDEGNRALMGSNMQCQAVPLITPESPVIGTGMESVVAAAMGRVVRSEYNGEIAYADANRIELLLDKPVDADEKTRDNIEVVDGGKKIIYYLSKFEKTAHSTAYNQKTNVVQGQKIKKGDLLIDGPAAQDGELALGINLTVAYTNYGGYGFEDAILVSDRLMKDDLLTSIHIKEYTADLVETKLGPEEQTRDIPNVAEQELANLAEDGIVVIGSKVSPGDILVGKIAPKGETELNSEERLLRAIFGEKAREVRDTSLKVPNGENGVVVDVSVLDKEKGDELGPGVLKSIVVKIAQIRKVQVGDKLAGRHGNKGVIAKVMPAEDMPYTEDGTPVDLIISPLSVLARMNLGQLLECHLGLALSKKGQKAALPVFDKVDESIIEKELESQGFSKDGKLQLYDGKTGEAFEERTVVGTGYILKLKHMIEDKTHARSTGPYSLVTQQPLGGKAQMGGQRLGEMEVWALETHRAAHVLQEMLTIKSDDIVGRAQAFAAIVKGEPIPEAKVPESFKVLIRELNSLGIAINVEGTKAKVTAEDGEIIETPALEEKDSKKQKHTDPLVQLKDIDDITGLEIRLASPDDIKAWSKGEVTKPETINYRTLKSEKDGLFDERIFGPSKDWECYCGKYKRIRYKGVICDKCGVEITESRVRRERMGHISLAAPVAHVWYFKGAPSKISLLLGLPPRAIEQVTYFARYLVMSVDEGARKNAMRVLEEAKASNLTEAKQLYKEKRNLVQEESKIKVERTKNKIKDKDQLELALSEIELESRKKDTAFAEEERATVEKTEELFSRLITVVKGVKAHGFVSEEEYDQLLNYEIADFANVKMGAEAFLEVLSTLDLDKEVKSVREELVTIRGRGARYVKLTKRLKIIEGMRKAKTNPAWMILKVLPVLPPDLRPMVQLSGGRFATSDLNDLYRRVINRNNRLKHLIGLGAPEIILRNEKRMLQESVDSLIDASQRKATRRGRGRQPLRSLSDMLKGKQGRFRQNLLGKRVDYSGRSVIIVGPELKLTQCGIPKDMALEIAKPFVLREMIVRGIAPNVKSAKNMLDKRPPEVYDILEEIIKDHPVILNRAPTLHKLGMQAFYPVLIEGSAIRIHPAVCKGFNADFDGDQMAVHLPLSKKAIEETRELMLADKNLLRPADGSPMAAPATKEIALGVYYFASLDDRIEPANTVFGNSQEAIFAYQLGKVRLRQQVSVRIGLEIIDTTVGRIIFNEILPSGWDFVNVNVSSSVINDIVDKAFNIIEHDRVIEMIDAIKDLGFLGGSLSGLSFSVSDAVISPEKNNLIEEANKKVAEIDANYSQGLITSEEKKRLSKSIWIETTEAVADKTWEMVDPNSSIRIVIDAKVGRTSRDQIKQLSGMRGLVTDPLGNIVELPVKSNFREGLNVFEYVSSGRGARKGLTDTALKTADAGYLTRRLVDVAHDMIVRLEDCGSEKFIKVSRNLRSKAFVRRIMGRFAAEDVVAAKGEVLVKAGEFISEDMAKQIDKDVEIETVSMRSPLTCKARYGICQQCYGWDLSTKELIEIGVPAGVMAAQSIGEPGTQLTMRTKHSGGVIGIDVTQGLPRVEELFESRLPKTLSPITDISGKVAVEELEDSWNVTITDENAKPIEERDYLIPKSNKLLVEDKQMIAVGTSLSTGFLDVKEILAIKGLKEAQEYLVAELQAVYESQGISIDDRHFEVIVKKMSDEIKIVTAGDTTLLPGDQLELSEFEEENEAAVAAGGEPATAKQILLGITRRALATQSWLSAASFEQTTDILSSAALMGKKDRLIGLKENVIIGRLIPVDEEKARSNVKQ